MKLSTTSFCIFLSLLLVNFSCTEQEPGLKKSALTKDEVLKMLESNEAHLVKVERTIGSQTTDLSNSEPYKSALESSVLTFRAGSILLVAGTKQPNTHFVSTAEIFSFQTKILSPIYIYYKWDEALGTIVAHSTTQGELSFGIPNNQDASLDMSSIVRYGSLEEAKSASIPPSFKFIYSTEDKDLGHITYTYTLKPLWGSEFGYVMF